VQQVENTLLPGMIVHGGGRDHYVVEKVLGKGGFSTIYLVRDRHLRQNLYALKEVIDPSKRERERFTFECELLMRLEHPSLPRVYRVFEESQRKRAYVLMDYIEGSNLERLRNQQPEKRLALAQVIDIMTPIVGAIGYLHRQNPPIVHRDIKPSNIIVPAGGEEAVLVDFGIAKMYEPEATTTAIRHCSPGYSAPEQYGIGTTPRTDIYGLGATLYTLLTGTIPADALERMIQLNEMEPDPLVPVNQLITTVPASVDQAISRAMSTRRTARFDTVEDFWQALTAGIERQQIPEPIFETSYPSDKSESLSIGKIQSDDGFPLQTKAQKPYSRKAGVIVAVVLAMLLLVGLGIGMAVRLSTVQQTSPVSTQKQTVTPDATPLVSPSSTSPVNPYPTIVKQYTGTVSDLIMNTTTNMSLTQVSQSAGNIHGYFTGLGLTGPFAGTVDAAGDIQFQVTIYGGTETIAFEGIIRLGGSLNGSYRVLRNQQFTGESGVWSVSP
jgi:eukaryotic-like serine/threonine-protein kinase